MANLPRLPHPVIILDDCPQLRSVIAELEAGTYPQPEDAVWRDDLPRDLAVRLAKATGATDEQIREITDAQDAESLRGIEWLVGGPGGLDPAGD